VPKPYLVKTIINPKKEELPPQTPPNSKQKHSNSTT
jgi:hypothetical protein